MKATAPLKSSFILQPLLDFIDPPFARINLREGEFTLPGGGGLPGEASDRLGEDA